MPAFGPGTLWGVRLAARLASGPAGPEVGVGLGAVAPPGRSRPGRGHRGVGRDAGRPGLEDQGQVRRRPRRARGVPSPSLSPHRGGRELPDRRAGREPGGSRVDHVERGTSCRGDRFAGRWGAGGVRRHGAQRSGLPPGDRRRSGCRRSSGAGTAEDSFRGPRPWIRGQCRCVLAGAPPSRRRPHPVRPRRTRPATGRTGSRPLCRRRSLHRPTGQGRRTGGLGGGRGAEPSGLRGRRRATPGLSTRSRSSDRK